MFTWLKNMFGGKPAEVKAEAPYKVEAAPVVTNSNSADNVPVAAEPAPVAKKAPAKRTAAKKAAPKKEAAPKKASTGAKRGRKPKTGA